jgi:hypothetical protein
MKKREVPWSADVEKDKKYSPGSVADDTSSASAWKKGNSQLSRISFSISFFHHHPKFSESFHDSAKYWLRF